jgi:hypothetical protein
LTHHRIKIAGTNIDPISPRAVIARKTMTVMTVMTVVRTSARAITEKHLKSVRDVRGGSANPTGMGMARSGHVENLRIGAVCHRPATTRIE